MNTQLLGKKPVQHATRASLALDVQYVSRDSSFAERHMRVGELAELWGLGRGTVRKLVKDDPGVIKIRQGRRKTHTTYSIHESAARRIHTPLLNVAWRRPPRSATSFGSGLASSASCKIFVSRACRSGTHAA